MSTRSLSNPSTSDVTTAAILLPLDRLDRSLLNALGSAFNQTRSDTGSYRVRGQDSLTWGDQTTWSKLNIIRYSFGQSGEVALEGYFDLDRAFRQARFSGLTEGYELRNAKAVERYMADHSELSDFLRASHQHLLRFFGSQASFVLEVVRDPEASTPSDLLFVNIRTAMPVNEAMARLDQFDENWYLDQVDSFGDLVNFNLEFYDL